RASGSVDSPKTLPVWSAHAVTAPTRPVQAPRIAAQTFARAAPLSVTRAEARAIAIQATTDTSAPSQPSTGNCSKYVMAANPTVPSTKSRNIVMARAYLASVGPFRQLRRIRPSAAFEGETNAKSDERASRDTLEPASRALDEPAETVDREGVERQPYEAEPRMDPGEEQRLRQHARTGPSELWEDRDIAERDL